MKVGDTVYSLGRYGRGDKIQSHTVDRVGRKYFYTGRTQVEIATLLEKTVYSALQFYLTEGEAVDVQERPGLRRKVESALHHASVAKLRRIIKILEE